MLVANKQLPLGRSHSWDTLGGNEGQWDRPAESLYDHQARVAGRRSSLSYGEGGGWYEPPPGVRPPDLDSKRDPYYQDPSYGQVYTDPRGLRKGSVPDLNHYERAPMAHRGSISHQDYYPHDPAMTPRPPEGYYRPEHHPPPPHPLSRSGSQYGMTPGARAGWDHGPGGRAGPQGPSSPLPPPPPPTAHELNRAAKMVPDGQQRIPSRAPSPAHYTLDHASPRYAGEPPPVTGQVYTDINGRPLDPQQQSATCLVVDPSSQGMVMRQDTAAPYNVQQQQQHLQQQQIQQQLQQQQQIQQQQIQQQLQQQQQIQQQQIQQQQLQQQQLQQQIQQDQMQQHLQQQPLPAAVTVPMTDPNLPLTAPVPAAPVPVQAAGVLPAPPAPVQPVPAPPPPVTPLPPPVAAPAPAPTVPQTPMPVDSKRPADPEFLALLRNEGLSESTISSLIHQGFDSTSMLAVMEENDVRTVAPNLGQARVLSRVVQNCKRPIEVPTAQPQMPMRGRSNSFSHRSDIYSQQQQHHPPHPPQTLTVDPQFVPPQTPAHMQSITPRIGDAVGRRPSSAPSQHLLEASAFPGQQPRSPGPYVGAMMPVQSRPMSAYSSGVTVPGMPMQGMQIMPQQISGSMPAIAGSMHQLPSMPQQMPISMPALSQPPQQVPKAYSTNYTVPMELMKRDRTLLPISPMHSPHPSPQLMRKGGGPVQDNALVPMGGPGQIQSTVLANQKLSRRTGPPVIVSTMASPDTS